MTEANDNMPLTAPGGLSLLSGQARVAAVIGWPISHSRSPRLHGYWLREYDIDGAYVPLAVPPETVEQALRALPALGFAGANVTLPHKEAAANVCETLTDRARRIGAVNTLVVRDGVLHGDNTDGYGFIENLRQQVPNWRAANGPAFVLGSGGSARAVCAALLEAGTREVRLLNRTLSRAEAIAEALGPAIRCAPLSECSRAMADAALLVNTTSLGMTGQPPLDLDLEPLPNDAVVTDLVYAPLETTLLAMARDRGNPVVDGLGMLLHQARPGFKAWFGRDPEVTDTLRQVVLND
jgi:shikimate dehydrogenase